jgi:amidophosphoribosyltransferase
MCGVVGIWEHPEAAKLTYLGLHALQHRGQEAAGIVAASEGPKPVFTRHVGLGLVADVFDERALSRLSGRRSIGHVRYSTAGGAGIQNAQPFQVDTQRGPLAVGHNGNLVNYDVLRNDLERQGAIFTTRSDTEILLHLLARARAPRIEDRIREALAQVEGAYTLVLMHQDGIIGVRDPHGYRPLVLGKLGEGYVLASETSSLGLIDATFVREIEPGEIVSISNKGVSSERLLHEPDAKPQACIFELVYFARPDSQVFSTSVHEVRFALGKVLAEEAPAQADLVIPVPDSGVTAAMGFAEAAGLPYRHGLIRSHYVGRTFIEPEQAIRHFGVKLKLSAVRSVLEGKRVVVVDDSIVRGTTSRKIVAMLRSAGATEVHLRISSPPTILPCFYGIDTPTQDELIAAKQDLPAIQRYVGADSLAYISVEGLHRSAKGGDKKRFCDACFTGQYASGLATIKERLPILR